MNLKTYRMPWTVVDHSCPRHCVACLQVVLPGLGNTREKTGLQAETRCRKELGEAWKPERRPWSWWKPAGCPSSWPGSPVYPEIDIVSSTQLVADLVWLPDCTWLAKRFRICTWSLLSARASWSRRASILSAIFNRKPARACKISIKSSPLSALWRNIHLRCESRPSRKSPGSSINSRFHVLATQFCSTLWINQV